MFVEILNLPNTLRWSENIKNNNNKICQEKHKIEKWRKKSTFIINNNQKTFQFGAIEHQSRSVKKIINKWKFFWTLIKMSMKLDVILINTFDWDWNSKCALHSIGTENKTAHLNCNTLNEYICWHYHTYARNQRLNINARMFILNVKYSWYSLNQWKNGGKIFFPNFHICAHQKFWM